LMGPTGAGKSSFIANVTKQEGNGVGHDLTSCTSEIKVTECDIEGFSIVLVDTPGSDHTNTSDLDILKLISDWLNAEYQASQPILSAILYFHRISDNRVAGTPLKNLRVFEKLCGKNAMSKVTLVTTMWDEVDTEVGQERLKELKESYWKGMVSRGSMTFECEDTQGSPMKLLRQIVQRQKEQELAGENSVYKTRHCRYPSDGSMWSRQKPRQMRILNGEKARPVKVTLDTCVWHVTGTFIANVAMQEGEGVGHDLTSCTSEIKATKLKLEEDSVVLVDTPGIDDTNKSDMHILKLISDWLKAEYPTPQPILSAILYFHRISDNRMAGTPLKNLRFFEKLCGKNAMSKVTLVTTMWDEVDTEVGTERLKELKEVHWKTMVSRGSMIFECEDARGSPMKLLHQIVQRKKEQEWMGENEGDDSPPEGPNSSPCMRRSDGICGGDAAVTGGARATDTIIA
ncbi:P-loop containing nucleoside triphosphate hydrolase protein, partial [Pisolithus sp. B1]